MHNYILKDGQPVPENDIRVWGKWFQNADRKIARDTIGDVYVSTVFLGLDHAFGGGAPMLFETMVFGGALDQECERYSTRQEAEAGHAAMIARVKAVQNG